MLIPVLISLVLVFSNIFIHGMATVWGAKQLLRQTTLRFNQEMKLSTALHLLSAAAVFLMVLHFIEISIWAFVFMLIPDIQELATFEEAIYFSLITYTTVGYGDITLKSDWRIMSGFLAMNGIMLFGWSTAMIYAVVQRILQKINPNSNAG